jgi:glycosyltransferase involved in cell wall biosynthesis
MSKILFVADSPSYWRSGIWFHRIQTPAEALGARGHGTKTIYLGRRGSELPQEMVDWCDTAVFGRTYPDAVDPLAAMIQLKKAGKRILYDLDDDYWTVAKDNPSVLLSNAQKDQYESLMREADAYTSPSPQLLKKMCKISKKPTFICPNGINPDKYLPRLNNHEGLVIGWMGAGSHWKDLMIVSEALVELNKKYDFMFVIYGITSEAMDTAIYEYKQAIHYHFAPEKEARLKEIVSFFDNCLAKIKFHHIAFRPPEMHPIALRAADFDIGIAPLEDTEFNRGKSCIKFYEYAAVGTVTLASHVLPYLAEVNYLAKNTTKDWYSKLEKLIINEKFRKELLEEQQQWVKDHHSLSAIGLDWELAIQKPGGLKVLNQTR